MMVRASGGRMVVALLHLGGILLLAGCNSPTTPTGNSSTNPRPTESVKPSATTPEEKPKETAPKETAPKEPVASGLGSPKFVLTPDELHAEKEKDGKAAQAKYNTQIVELKSEVQYVGAVSDSSGQRSVSLKGKNIQGGLTCFLKDTQAAGKLARGRTIRLKGRIAMELIGENAALLVNDCEILELGPETAVRATAEDLARQFKQDLDEAKDQFADKTIIVTGIVLKKGKNIEGVWGVELKGDNSTVIVSTFSKLIGMAESKPIEQLQEGQRVTLAGEFSGFDTKPGRVAINASRLFDSP